MPDPGFERLKSASRNVNLAAMNDYEIDVRAFLEYLDKAADDGS